MPDPSARIDLRGLFLATALSLGGAVALAWDALASFGRHPAPLAAQGAWGLSRVVGSPETETWTWLWGQAWILRNVLETGRLPAFDPWLDYPAGGHLWVKDPLTTLLVLPVHALLGGPAAFTANLLLCFTMAGAGGFLLAGRLGVSRWPALAAGLTFAFCPHALGEAYNANLEALNAAWMPLALWSLLGVVDRPTLRTAGVAATALFALLLTNQYYAIATTLLAVPVLAVAFWRPAPSRPRALGWLVAAALGAGLAFLPFAATLRDTLQAADALNQIDTKIHLATPWITDLSHLARPLAPLDGPAGPESPFQDLVWPGFLLAGLALLAPFLGVAGPWRVLFPAAALGFAVLSLGPALSVDGHLVLRDGSPILLPWATFSGIHPLFRKMTLPHRMAMPEALCLSMALALLLEGLATRLPARIGTALAIGVPVAVLAEFALVPPYRLPLATTSVAAPAHARLLAVAREADADGALLNLPPSLGPNRLTRYLYWHSLHRRPVADSLRKAVCPTICASVPWVQELASAWKDRRAPSSAPADTREGLLAAGYRYVVLHGWYFHDGYPVTLLEPWQLALEGAFGPGISLSDGTVVWDLDPTADLPARAEEVLPPADRIPPAAPTPPPRSPGRSTPTESAP